ncbi:translation initiation factor IF-2 subunit beta [Candidatus Micrarchaeota archaeon]|jgi:translation initiation factor 2 subunit 2|nr:translation initiation factor IF-2 subunit beta [Candidatus Micrarchaeota archaeon]
MENYESLLDKAYEEIPKKAKTSERFEVPKPEILVEGSKTIIKNFDQILITLRSNKDLMIKYFSKELAVPVAIEGKRLVLYGKVQPRLFVEKLNTFVKKFVVCRECNRPDTSIKEMDKGIKVMICEACGARTPIR